MALVTFLSWSYGLAEVGTAVDKQVADEINLKIVHRLAGEDSIDIVHFLMFRWIGNSLYFEGIVDGIVGIDSPLLDWGLSQMTLSQADSPIWIL